MNRLALAGGFSLIAIGAFRRLVIYVNESSCVRGFLPMGCVNTDVPTSFAYVLIGLGLVLVLVSASRKVSHVPKVDSENSERVP